MGQDRSNESSGSLLLRGTPLGVLFRRFSLDDFEEDILNVFGYRAAPAGANLWVVNFGNRRQFRRGAGKKCFVGDIEFVASKALLGDGIALVTRQRDDRLTGNAR